MFRPSVLIPSLILLAAPCGLFAGAPPSATPTPAFSEKDYFVAHSLRLHGPSDGFEGRLLVLQDKKMKARKDPVHRQLEDQDFLNDGNPGPEFKNAVVALRSKNGKLLERLEMGCPWAEVKKADLGREGVPTYQVTEDRNRGALIETYEAIRFVEVVDGHLSSLKAIDKKENETDDVELDVNMYSDWKTVPSPSGKGKEVHFALADGFGVHLDRYFFNGKDWEKTSRTIEPGRWLPENGFPDQSYFEGKEPKPTDVSIFAKRTSQEGRFIVLWPQERRKDEVIDTTPWGPFYNVAYQDQAANLEGDPVSFLKMKAERNNYPDNQQYVRDLRSTTYRKYPAVDFRETIGEERFIQTRLVLVNKRLYQLTCETDPKHYKSGEAERFFDSLEFIEPELNVGGPADPKYMVYPF